MRALLVIAAVLASAAPVLGQARGQEPLVFDGTFATYDLAALKGGEWAEYENSTVILPAQPNARGSTVTWRLACVAVEPDTVYLETTQPLSSIPDWKGTVVLVAVDKASGKTTKAWWGKPGETGKEIKVTAMPSQGAPPGVETTGTGKSSRETIQAAGAEYECEKIEVDMTMKSKQGETRVKSTAWNSEKVPFRVKTLPEATRAAMENLKWDTKPSGKGYVVKSVAEMSMAGSAVTSTTTMTLKGCGTDAKPSLEK